jgi:formylglycine-generating enzyme required for sulfatase activity
VRDTGLNEIFIDLLQITSQNQQGETVKKKLQKPVPPNKKTQIEQEANIIASGKPEIIVANMLENMVPINGGSFIMGNNKAPSQDEAEHTVTVKSVLFSRYEVTQGQWQAIMGNNPSINKGCNNCPVENVSWEDVMKFIKKLNELSNKNFRLPTEAEWEFVARFGGKEEIEKAGGPEEFIKSTAWYYANSDKKTHPVGQLKPNAAGIYDLFGNVSEWCSDWYSPEYFKEENQKHPIGPPLGKEKLVRGGSFVEYSGDRFRPSIRNKLKPVTKDKSVGFRMVMDVN